MAIRERYRGPQLGLYRVEKIIWWVFEVIGWWVHRKDGEISDWVMHEQPNRRGNIFLSGLVFHFQELNRCHLSLDSDS